MLHDFPSTFPRNSLESLHLSPIEFQLSGNCADTYRNEVRDMIRTAGDSGKPNRRIDFAGLTEGVPLE